MRLFRPQREHNVVLFGKPGCHLCEDAEALLTSLARRHSLQVTRVDITTSPDLYREYDIRIPVIVVDDRVVLEAPIHEKELRAALSR